ncbi:MAG TPA: hypothetical protein VMT55_00750, partial [Candidatus Sulfotelmatobacter sp.]|nr:hypothetical protein [Candidatus Sulfotelmatobacter sp.]
KADLPRPPAGMTIQLTTWQYGTVAQILHIGPYDKERPDVDRLHEFIRANGYRITGMHEEEYIRGPGMFFRGNPEKYFTVIRYQVEKRDSTAAALASAN